MSVPVSSQLLFTSEHEALSHVVQCVEHQVPSFFAPTTTVNEHQLQLNWLFQFMLNNRAGNFQEYFSYFCQSGLEALLDTVATLSCDQQGIEAPQTLLVGNGKKIQALFPSDHITSNPDIHSHTFAVAENDALLALAARANQIRAVIYAPSKLPDHFLYRSLASYCQQRRLLLVLDFSECRIDRIDTTLRCHEHKPDIVIWGEMLAKNSLPFGAISIADKPQFRQQWQQYIDSAVKFSGCSLAWSYVVKQLLNEPLFEDQLDFIKRELKRLRPPPAKVTCLPDFEQASGMYLSYTDNDKKCRFIDCHQNGGAGVKGHNPADFARRLRSEHKPDHDYWSELLAQLEKLTGLHDAFPAVSPTGACHIAFTLGLNANLIHGKLVILHDGNMTSINRVAIAYSNTVYINQNQPNATNQLKRHLDESQTALVWFESSYNIHSNELNELIELINQRKSADHFYVGVNECHYGLYRGGRLFSHHGSLAPDIITLANGLDAMMIPFAVCMVSKRFSQRIKHRIPQVYQFYQTQYSNATAAHVALLSLKAMKKENTQYNVEQISLQLRQSLMPFCHNNRLISAISGEGMAIRLQLNRKLWSLRLLSNLVVKPERFLQDYFNHLCICEAKMLPFGLELMPPLNCSKSQAEEIVAQLAKVLSLSHWHILTKGLKFWLRYRSQQPMS